MKDNPTLLDVCEDYVRYIQAQLPPKKSKPLVDQFRSVLRRVVVLGLGHTRSHPHSKMTRDDNAAASAFLDSLPARDIVKVPESLHRGFEQLGTSQASRNTYTPRILDWAEWGKSQPWFPGRARSTHDQRCPSMLTGRGPVTNHRLTHRTGRNVFYGLKLTQCSPDLQSKFLAFNRFLTADHHPERLIEMKPIQQSSARLYEREILLMLGHQCQRDDAAVSVAVGEIQFSNLVPVVEEESLEGLTRKQCQQIWQEQRQQLADWWASYDVFLRETCESISPRTRVNKLCALIALTKFQYRHQVNWETEYAAIPVIQLLYSYLKVAIAQAAEWTAMQRTVVDREQKWLEPQPHQNSLTAIWEQVVLPLQQETRCRDQWGQLRKPRAIAKSYKSLLIWHRLGSYPAARQSVLRTQKIATYCPIERPADVPQDGWYWPKVPLEWRERDRDQRPIDNCFYRTYIHQGKSYPEGIYVLEVCNYKTLKKYGIQSYVIANQEFEDGICLYDIYEQYLCGLWVPGGDKNDALYDWWVPEWRGQRGRWVTKGRMEFKPDSPLIPLDTSEGQGWQAPWGYLFVNPLTGNLSSEANFGRAFRVAAYRLTGKQITPHVLRSVWATWGFEMGLSQQQLMALAYAMGHSLDTLRRIYDRSTPEEKRRPIDEVIEQGLFNPALEGRSADAASPLDEAMVIFQQLPLHYQQLLKVWLDLHSAD
jgi:hypothetical protein